jgi:nucleotide-binding universal stress UspA family protein
MTGTELPRCLLVPLDGSPFAERALPVAERLAAAIGAELHVVRVVPDDYGIKEAEAYLDKLISGLDTPVSSAGVDVGRVPASVIQKAGATLERAAVCLATHGRGRLATAVLGSVADAVIATSSSPVVVIGPAAGPGPAGAPVLACVDGSALSERTVSPAVAWAGALGVGVTVVTVAEPVPESVSQGGPHYRRQFGPNSDAGVYADEVASRAAGAGVQVTGEPIYDPISPADGVASYLADRPAQLVAATAHATAGSSQPFIGSTAAALVRRSPVPVLLTPIREGHAGGG